MIERGGRIAHKEGGELDDKVGIMELLLEEYSFMKLLLAQNRFKNNNVRNNSDSNSFIMTSANLGFQISDTSLRT